MESTIRKQEFQVQTNLSSQASNRDWRIGVMEYCYGTLMDLFTLSGGLDVTLR